MGIEDADSAAYASAAVVRYLEETQFGGAGHVLGIRPLLPDGMLILDRTTQINLELLDGETSSLFAVLDSCKTSMGRRLLRDWIAHPLTDLERIGARQDCVEFLAENTQTLRALGAVLSKCRDMERALGRLSLKVGNPRDVGAIRDTLLALPEILALVRGEETTPLSLLFRSVPDLSELKELLSSALFDDLPRALSAGGVIRTGFDAELDDSKDAILHAEENLRSFEQKERERTGIKVRVGINKVFGYYIEVGKSHLDRVPDDYSRRQTVVSGERFVNEALKEIERRVFRAEREIEERETRLYGDIVERTLSRSSALQEASRSLAKLDVLRTLAEVARDNAYVRPKMDRSRVFDVKGARHPVVEKALGTVNQDRKSVV